MYDRTFLLLVLSALVGFFLGVLGLANYNKVAGNFPRVDQAVSSLLPNTPLLASPLDADTSAPAVAGLGEARTRIRTLSDELKSVNARLAEATNQVVTRDTTISELEGNLDALEAKAQGLESNRDALQAELSQMVQTASSSETSSEALSAKITELETNLGTAQTRAKTLEGERDALQEELSQMVEAASSSDQSSQEFSETITELEDNLRVAQTKLGELEGERDALQKELSQSVDAATASQSTSDDLTASMAKLETTLAEKETALATLDQENRKLTAQIDEMTAASSAAASQTDDLRAKLAAIEQERAAAQEANAANEIARDNIVEELVAQKDGIEASLEIAGQARDAAESEVERLKSVLVSREQELGVMTKTLREKEVETGSLRNQLAKLTEGAASGEKLAEIAEAAEAAAAKTAGQVAELSENLDARTQELETVQGTVADLQAQLSTRNAEIAELEEKYDGLTTQKAALDAEYRQLQDDHQNLIVRIDQDNARKLAALTETVSEEQTPPLQTLIIADTAIAPLARQDVATIDEDTSQDPPALLQSPGEPSEDDGLPAQALTSLPAGQQFHFDLGATQLSEGVKTMVAELAEKYRELDLQQIQLIGFTDRTGSASRNEYIAQKRVESVMQVFIDAGFSPDLFDLVGKGEMPSMLPFPTDDGVAEPMNRCVLVQPVLGNG